VHNIALQIASMAPTYISMNDIPAKEMERVRNEALERVKSEGKSADIAKKIVDGQIKKYFEEKVLLSQVYIMDDKLSVEDYLKENIAKTGENLVIRQFKRMELGVTE
jgi:elongation factor Ts